MNLRIASVLAFVSIGAALPFGCSATDDPAGPGGSGGGNGGSGNTGTGATGPGGFGFDGGGGGPPGQGCSPDLQSVVDANGNVVLKCPVDQGCSGGACVPACQAAADSKGSIGCDFWAPDPPFLSNGGGSQLDGPCYAVFLANTWGRSAKITVTRGGQPLDVTQFGRIPKGIAPNTTYDPLPAEGVPPNEVAVLFLSHKPGVTNFTSLECPVPPAVLADTAVSATGKGQAFRVALDTPVSAYDILPYGGAASYLPSATLLYPSTAWGTNYYAVAPHNTGSGSLWAAVVAREDNTVIQVAPAASLPGGTGVAPAPQGQTTSYTLDAGEIIQWLDPNFNSLADPTSAVFESDKPVGLWTGNTYLGVSTATSPGGGGQDSAHQQIAHVKALGNEYVGAGVVTRLPANQPESVPYRLLGVVDGTQLTWDPSPPAGAPSTLGAGQVAEFETTQTFAVRSQDEDHPFAFTQYLPGTPGSGSLQGCGPTPPFPGMTCGLGDEEWVALIPPKQYLHRYVFFADPTYATTNLVIVRVKGTSGFSDVDVACLGGPVSGWQPIGNGGLYEYAHVDLVRGTVPVANCNTSRHEATSNGAFGVVVWGTDWYSSYGYPAGGNIGTINDVVVPPDPK